ncbi:hypothetical protein BCR43DRAFT_6800 [Syncephalastrum racemosum]|uniref:Uncharacterized protein n=1 Tax=Syncephalastrum racemosum TaxID=13706 RepID=A0A1X2HS09_SYNRA|nr:hypothetical protein BCR43DRAFT_6800 [Syncephalastrum racemosum]
MDRMSDNRVDRDQEHEQDWEDDPSPLELEALRQIFLQRNQPNVRSNDGAASSATGLRSPPPREQQQPQSSDAEGETTQETTTTSADKLAETASAHSSLIEEKHQMNYDDINPLEMEALRQQVLTTHEDSYEKNVLEAARLVDRNLGGGLRPAAGTTSCRGIQSTLNANQQSALGSAKATSIATSKTPSRRRISDVRAQ